MPPPMEKRRWNSKFELPPSTTRPVFSGRVFYLSQSLPHNIPPFSRVFLRFTAFFITVCISIHNMCTLSTRVYYALHTLLLCIPFFSFFPTFFGGIMSPSFFEIEYKCLVSSWHITYYIYIYIFIFIYLFIFFYLFLKNT